MLRIKLVLWVIWYSIKRGANPWYYFQLNASWFNNDKGIFSKLDIDNHIPPQWRLSQQALSDDYQTSTFPVFLKPEWGQNSYGIIRVDDQLEWAEVVPTLNLDLSYIVQSAASGAIEYEIFYVRDAANLQQFSMLSITKAKNKENTKYPINSIRNANTTYSDCTEEFDTDQHQQLWRQLSSIGEFKIARVCCRCENAEALVSGDFQIIEINLFVPMPLKLMDTNVSSMNKKQFLRDMGDNLARLIKAIPAEQPYKPIFFRKWALHRKMLP